MHVSLAQKTANMVISAGREIAWLPEWQGGDLVLLSPVDSIITAFSPLVALLLLRR